MATASFQKDFSIDKKTEKKFLQLFDKKPKKTFFKDSKYESVRNNKKVIEALINK